MADKNIHNAFFELLRAGLWEQEVRLVPYGEIDFEALLQQAEEQSVVGLVAAGIEHVTDKKPQKKDVLQFIGRTVQLEQRNQAMNYFIGVIVEKMRAAGIEAVLVKGQGVAQCYERPLWRSCGDVDLLLDAENYGKAKSFLLPLATSVDEEDKQRKHLGITIDPWLVELHGTLHTRQLMRLNGVLDEVQREVFEGGRVRTWKNDAADVLLPAPDEDVFFVFSHIIQHFFGGGIGLRQVCDWCRLLWTFKDSIDASLLENRLREAGILTEWKTFAALAVEWLGMPAEAMPLFGDNQDHNDNENLKPEALLCRLARPRTWTLKPSLRRKGSRIMAFILETGNFGHNRDNSFRQKSFLVRSLVSTWRYTCDTLSHLRIFPLDSLKVWGRMVWNGVRGRK